MPYSFRAILISDVHMSNSLPHARPTASGETDRLLDQVALWERVHESARERNVDAIFVLGDLFDKSVVDPVTLTATAKALAASPVTTYILPGNHDANGERFLVEAFEHFGSSKIVYLGTRTAGYRIADWLRFWPIAFCDPDLLRASIGAISKQISKSRVAEEVALLHHSILGCKHEGWTCNDGIGEDEATAPFDSVFAGHFHTTQGFGDGKGLYLGAPLRWRFDDATREAGYWYVSWEKTKKTVVREIEFIDGGAPRFHVATLDDVEEFKHGIALVGRPPLASGDYVRIVVEATHAEWAKAKDGVVGVCRRMVEEQGVRASWKHKPLYHHGRRLKSKKTTSKRASFRSALDEYVAASDVDTSGLDSKRLRRIGAEILEEALGRDSVD